MSTNTGRTTTTKPDPQVGQAAIHAAAAVLDQVAGGTVTQQAAGAPVVTQNGRQSTGQAEGAPVVAKRKVEPKFALKGEHGRRRREQWYLDRTSADLAMVTDAKENPSLGITDIVLMPATENAAASGMLCRVELHSILGIDRGITVWQSNNNNDIYMRAGGSRDVPNASAPNGKKTYYDRVFSDAAQAQILSYIWSNLEPV